MFHTSASRDRAASARASVSVASASGNDNCIGLVSIDIMLADSRVAANAGAGP
ncbi:hypothetical protein D3C83_250130 [compost metagenome]